MKIASLRISMCVVVVCMLAGSVSADLFGTGANQFTIDFVDISGDASSANGTNISQYSSGDSGYKTFTDPSSDYRMGTYEITNDQYAKFATNSNVYFTGDDVPSNTVSWYEAAQFVNFLNTSTGHEAAYIFTGSTMSAWDVLDIGYDASNPFRNSGAYYFMPTEDEWVKAAYWNGASLQTHATKAGDTVYQGNGSNGGWNYYFMGDYGPDGSDEGPWNFGSGSEELNGTFDMMGNLWEWMESPWVSGDFLPGGIRGSSFTNYDIELSSSFRRNVSPDSESLKIGFRVASVPEPCSLVLLGLGGLVLRRRYKR